MSIDFSAEAILSKKTANLKFLESSSIEDGIEFRFSEGTTIKANADFLTAANRNTVLGNNGKNLCFVEHLLAAIYLLKLDKIAVEIDCEEIPLLDGSSEPWVALLERWPYKQELPCIELKQELSVSNNKGSSVIAIPSESFKMSYLFECPVSKKKTWVSWTEEDGYEELVKARTFGSKQEHEMLGIVGRWLSYDASGFDLELNSHDEPAMHKALDLFGDLSLIGQNPLSIKAHFISIKGGHALNTQMAKLLRKTLKQ
ncbi:MAG TPA: UDP-3-O-acyl-N-acetylglucosamine deacetylase [Vampirovibrionales bacterium]